MIVEPKKKMVYFGIHTEGQAPKRKFWRGLVFESDILAEFYIDQEFHALPENELPPKFRVDFVEDWEIEGRNGTQTPMKEFKLPSSLLVMLTDFYEDSSMVLKMAVNNENPPHYFFSTSFSLSGSPQSHDLEIGKSEDVQIFGARLRPLCFAPKRQGGLSFRNDKLPGLWYFTIGYRREQETLPIFLDEVDPCSTCPVNPR